MYLKNTSGSLEATTHTSGSLEATTHTYLKTLLLGRTYYNRYED
jgi:hypothetical protein